MIARDEVEKPLLSLLGRLRSYVVDWKFTFVPAENTEYEPGIDREAADLADANVVSSELKYLPGNHLVAIDLDVEAYLVPSSTPGHSHLYIGGRPIPHDDYMELLRVLAKCYVIEPGYAEVSIKRGHSDLRLPWVDKRDQKIHELGPGVNMAPLPVPAPISGPNFPAVPVAPPESGGPFPF